MRPELIYSQDLDVVLSLLRRARSEPRQSYDFYNACLERLNSLLLEKNSMVRKPQVLQILDELSRYRPKEEDV